MIVPATASHSLLLEHAHVRGGFARVDERGPAALEQRSNMAGIGGDAAHALKVVECHAFARQERANITEYSC